MTYVVTYRWDAPDLDAAKRATEIAQAWYAAHGGAEGIAGYQIVTGEHVGQAHIVVRYADLAAYAKTHTAFQESEANAAIQRLAHESGAKLMDIVHFRSL
jgi:hypothetical protein